MAIKILMAADHQLMREGLLNLIESLESVEVIGEANDGCTVVRKARNLKPDVVVMDVEMPKLNGIEATRQILAESPLIKVIALSMHSERPLIKEMFRAGASAYLLKGEASEELVTALKSVCENRFYMSPDLMNDIVKRYAQNKQKNDSSTLILLTKREKEVLQLITEGKTVKDIAFLLELSIKSVETHRKRIMEKLDIHSVAQLTKYAIREGLTSLEY